MNHPARERLLISTLLSLLFFAVLAFFMSLTNWDKLPPIPDYMGPLILEIDLTAGEIFAESDQKPETGRIIKDEGAPVQAFDEDREAVSPGEPQEQHIVSQEGSPREEPIRQTSGDEPVPGRTPVIPEHVGPVYDDEPVEETPGSGGESRTEVQEVLDETELAALDQALEGASTASSEGKEGDPGQGDEGAEDSSSAQQPGDGEISWDAVAREYRKPAVTLNLDDLSAELQPRYEIDIDFSVSHDGLVHVLSIMPPIGNTEAEARIKQWMESWDFLPVPEETGSSIGTFHLTILVK
jgi:hypothetical protein